MMIDGIETDVQGWQAPVRKESFGGLIDRINGLFAEMEIAETPEEKALYGEALKVLLSEDLSEKTDALASVVARGNAWAEEAKRLSVVAQQHAKNAEQLKSYVLQIMEANGIKELKTATSRMLACGNGGLQPLEIQDGVLVPKEFRIIVLRVPEECYETIVVAHQQASSLGAIPAQLPEWLTPSGVEFDSKGLRSDLSAGRVIPGVSLLPRGKHLRVTGGLRLGE
jgi:Siphovirus Gp157